MYIHTKIVVIFFKNYYMLGRILGKAYSEQNRLKSWLL